MYAMVTEDGVAIQESAVCDKHYREFSDEAYELGSNAEDLGQDDSFHVFDAEYCKNNDIVCMGCRFDRQIEEEKS